jgi:flagellar basal-body rod protein FlgF
MESPMFIALSSASVLRKQTDVLAHNIANMNTNGFKAQNMLAIEHLAQPPESDSHFSMVTDYATVTNTSEGPIRATGNPLDVALQGDGYFAVETGAGPRYTRDGSFTINDEGVLVNQQGLRILDVNNDPIEIPDGIQDIEIDSDGNIALDGIETTQLQVVTFDTARLLQHLGNGLYNHPEAPFPAEDTNVVQGTLEGSNVNGVGEMTQLINVQRSYQRVQNMMNQEHERVRQMIRTLGQAQ